jgi:ribonuclease HII
MLKIVRPPLSQLFQNKLEAYENMARQKGFQRVAGVDEAGRGPLAGPVVAAACYLPPGTAIPFINDSKKLSALKRAHLLHLILQVPGVDYGVGIVESQKIDQINILQATFQAMIMAVNALTLSPDFLLIDGPFCPPFEILSEGIIKGDSLSQSIMAASIIAKCTRDKLMEKYDLLWPGYGFKKHKGYGTRMHIEALQLLGPCSIHRYSFAPIKKC